MTENKNIVMRESMHFVDLSYRVQRHV